jgi:transmembrane sensor
MLTIEQIANRWVVRQAEHGLDPDEQADFDAWCAQDARHLGAYARALAIHDALVDVAGRLEARGLDVEPAVRPGRERMGRADRWSVLRYGAMAAGIAAVFVAATLFSQPRSISFATAVGEFRRVPLADQSIANINSGSRIDVTLTDRLRQVDLNNGEAWFEVAKDKSRPFVVNAGFAHVRAVGTSFGVDRQGDAVEIAVTEGVVEVWRSGASGQSQLVTAGEQATVPANGGAIAIVRRPDDIARKLAWREGQLVFIDQTLALAVAEFNRYSRKKLVVADPKLAQRRLAGQYRVDDPERFARAVSTLFGAPLAITHDRIIMGDVRLLDRAAADR